ncbi:MFS transporter [Algiphilus sp. W345]|uniref:MFS transporter n=1 Tax=Banduia mediterranea TaxID=3075609 RepID=A0ABU2WDQ4_9GAMM|nr:MFS transporter [Algiphilus sp. W345]MDT0496008.1 MFS transporter [Algiphilus sp. W345]
MREQHSSVGTARASWRGLPASVWALGFGSLFMDMSSELVHSLLPLFMSTTLGASMFAIGVLEGVAEATAAITKVFSGALSDRLGRRKPLLIAGYGLAALSKPVFPLAGSIGWVFAARFVDRIGKGIRGAPRDALVADVTAPLQRGAAYGLRQSLDSVGAFLGPMLAVALMLVLAGDLQAVLWIAVLPAFISVLLLWVAVREPQAQAAAEERRRIPLRLADMRRLPARYWWVVLLGGVFTLARFSEAFLILRAHDVGLGLSLAPLVMIVMSVIYAASALPAGIAADRISARHLLFAGLLVLVAADVMLALATGPALVLMGAAVWGLHMGLTQGLFSKLVADTAPASLRATGFGLFNLVSGGALLLASLLAGLLWQQMGAAATFIGGAAFAGLAACGLLVVGRRPRR